ncbi:hypothetical protein HQ585_19540 [candidate division KSB1 bacterium]|nr:hypothetical protein [candidate division KSB1 bacterium]
MIWHPELEKRWSSFPEHQQILMICNELNRAGNLQSDPKEYKNALERALELMDFTIDDPRSKTRLREFLRARQLVAGLYLDVEPHQTKTLQKTLIQLSPAAWKMMQGMEV